MKISLFYENSIYTFMLPKEISGSYSFDVDKNETSKLINVEAREGRWVIYSIEGVTLLNGNMASKGMFLVNDTFYVMERRNKKYLIYVSDITLDKLSSYTYKNLSMVIGNTSAANIKYNCPYLGNNEVKITKDENSFILTQSSPGLVYLNNKIVKETQTNLKVGDFINIFGLKIIFLNDLLFMNSQNNKISIPVLNFGASLFLIPTEGENKNIIIYDKDLYDKKDYYSKSPRIRRIIETKKMKLSPPPQSKISEDMPLILTIGPMATMGIMSMVTVVDIFTKVSAGQTTFSQSWPQMITAGAMLGTMLLWPLATRFYNKKMQANQKKELEKKYDGYLTGKEKEVKQEAELQKSILTENLISINECLNIINKKGIGFWDKRLDQNDFLVVRLGMGTQPLDLEIEYPDQEFTIEEDELRKQADNMVEKYKEIPNVPVSYSFYENMITAIMGFDKRSSFAFTNNILLQLLTFYSYEDLKLVILTNEENKENWEYTKYLNHTFNNERNFRFFASNPDSAKIVCDYLANIFNARDSIENKKTLDKPYYIIVCDDYDSAKRLDFMKNLTESDSNVGFSLIILEDKLNKLPSKCNNFISLTPNTSAILKNSYEKQEQIPFKDEINYNIDMMNIAKIMSNIPIEFEDGALILPDSISFLEMHGVGKVEQLNVLNRWNTSDPTRSLKAEIGIDEQGNPMYLDLHEKYHGPHGLIAGTTGSGKSEFIITYILSMCINYSPDDVSFILIDYKGGGVALAFENKATGFSLPHLAGTITNLDKSEMDRTLVSIDSEVKRRQAMFNAARDALGESTIDIYKYQRFYKEGKVQEPIPHLFIICDEFAELKAQQPDFMDNLISVARIGRSLGVHLILSTQKPSGVVNDQIWSNTRFRVCLKVQDEQDSKEMLKRPEAAAIKQAGRYYLQVGYDEYFALGQSGYAGSKYYPSDTIIKHIDKSVSFINDYGEPIKSIEASNEQKLVAQGEQLGAVMKQIIDVSNMVGKKSRRLWLSNVSENITVDNLEVKYSFTRENYHPCALLGEYDAPEKQEQGKVTYDFLKDGNTAIYGNDGSEREQLLSTLIYSTCKNYTSSEVNFYILDYGSESLRRFSSLPQVGGMAFSGEEEKYNNLLKLIRNELNNRKKLFTDFGGEYENYIKSSPNKLPIIVVIVNNYDSIYEANPNAYDEFPDLVRDSERYGVIFVFTGNGINSIHSKISQNLPNVYAYKLKDSSDYSAIFESRGKVVPRDIFGRGILDNGGLHEFQTAKITNDIDNLNEFLQMFISGQKQINEVKAKRIPTLPEVVRFDDVASVISDLHNVPVGIDKNELDITTVDFLSNTGNIITSNKAINTLNFVLSLLQVFKSIPKTNTIVFDPVKVLNLDRNIFPNSYQDNFDIITDKIGEFIEKLTSNKSTQQGIILIYSLTKYLSKLTDSSKFVQLIDKLKKYENISLIIVDDAAKLKQLEFESWFRGTFSVNDGIWIGRGITDQSLLHVSSLTKEMTLNYKNDKGYLVSENQAILVKWIDFITSKEEKNE